MALELGQSASWPGVAAVESCTGTVSHGITPGVFVMSTYPQTAAPRAFGDLVLSDGVRAAVFRGCKLDAVSGRAGPDGQTFTLTILDRRWRWRYGAISGRYNQLDKRGKLVPWTIRSPQELAELCLKAMGERNYVINLPAGLTAAAGANLEQYLRAGEDFPQSLTNPPTVWDLIPPAEALARLADLYGCRVIYQPFADRVVVAPLGAGGPLTDFPCESIAPNVDGPETPSAVGVAGAPVRVQMRLLLEPVGKEWDGSYRPVNELSYAPQGGGKVQISTAAYDGAGPNPSIKVYLRFNRDWAAPAPLPDKAVFAQFGSSAAGSAADKLADVAAAINGHPDCAPVLKAEAAGDVLTVTGLAQGFPFELEAESSSPGPPDRFEAAVVQPPERPGPNWESCPLPNFPAVRATDRLSYDQAVLLAQGSVFKCYRVLNADAETGRPPIRVPGYGGLVRRHQLTLQPTKVDQVAPEPREKGVIRRVPNVDEAIRGPLGGLPEFYDGYSRDQGADVYGSVWKLLGNVVWDGDRREDNTGPEDKVYVPIAEIDPISQVVTFTDYVYRYAIVAGTDVRQAFPTLTLETAVLVSVSDTGELVRAKYTAKLGGAAPVEWQIREDVQLCVRGRYGPKNKYLGREWVDQKEAEARAAYYLAGMAHRYRVTGGETRQYIGIHLINLDGHVQQVSWSVGPGGASTVASTNSEHSASVPPYAARRRAENLPPDKSAALANFFEEERAGRLLPPR
ncbi:hypothetical protein GobsT_37800 [Gemmata obscuriglobus]|uniref:Uncharacterized protein n=1 Tax=Gemmata obscuriglobus TaxID=114 RepID=A0A2Z3H333_9BACT|nr:hypothetical protein [Gemmata obscuriglobus]AWM38127.1 hypothetical protein C1280_14745 [Gemmata obscuriglobus]QEG28991.1 hypothetical protein GobsT_37800 [Gemmata obscuriglobus]VTS07557.1 Uncharacterized protein OS=Planctomyces maris DSM 8797 GN=PM8797T_10914 PE=4 SV=1 [Gemmata obscuriglobus UQM 2246]